jgi:HEAT repeat protein
MSRWTKRATWLIFAVVLGSALPAGAAPADEQSLIAVLQSDKPAAEKAAACRSLKTVGTARAVPALAPLLADKDLSYWARYALGTMPCPEAGAALRDALAKASGVIRSGIIDSIGERADREAVPALAELVRGDDPQVVASAAVALGRIGGAEAAQALRTARGKAPAAAQPAIADGLLLAAERFLAAGDKKSAAAIYRELGEPPAPEYVRTAAFRGLVLASDDQATALLAKAFAGNDRAAQRAALQLVREVRGEGVTKAIAEMIAGAAPADQAPLIEALRQRGDPAAAPAVIVAAESPAPEVRAAALAALGTLGDASIAARLAEVAAKAAGPDQDAAREALAQLRDPKVREVLVAALPKATPAVQAEIVRALGRRLEKAAVPMLVKMAETGDDATRPAALRSLAALADAGAAGDLIRLLRQAKTDAERDAAEQALAAACGRGERPEASVALVLAGMKDAPVAVRASLLRVAGRVGGAEALQALRAGLTDGDATIREAALRTMADFSGPEAAPDLLKLAADAPVPGQRVLAVRGYWRLVGLADRRPTAERWKMCEVAMAIAQRPEEKKLGLTEMAKVPHVGALKLAESLASDEAVAAEAQAACVQIAAALMATQPVEAKAALQKIADTAKDENLRAQAAKALGAVDQHVGYITAWLVAGPYRQAGKQCRELFDIPFPPERPGAADVQWKPAPAPADPSLAWQVDLLSVVDADQCVVYAKSRVYSPREQRVRLEIGSDDGIKLWLNGKLAHSNNVLRPLKAGSDQADAVLQEGWNDFLAKITQNNMGCGLCIRVRGPGGGTLEGLRSEASAAVETNPLNKESESMNRRDFLKVSAAGAGVVAGLASAGSVAHGAAAEPAASAAPAAPAEFVVPPGVIDDRAKWTKITLDKTFRSEGVAVGDINKDGKLDIMAGEVWYEAPDWKMHEIATPGTYNAAGGYSKCFQNYAMDVNGDGWIDSLVITFPGQDAVWFENPQGKPGPWKRRVLAKNACNETPLFADLLGNGKPVLIFPSNGRMAWFGVPKDLEGLWDIHAISEAKAPGCVQFSHGLGLGDINGNGRNDVLIKEGWWEAPEDRTQGPWKFHAVSLGQDCADLLVYDVDGDGLNDVITSSAHKYGIWWHQQVRNGAEITFKQHDIFPNLFSESHALVLADINGDGVKDFVVGKRFWAHGPKGDPGAAEPAVLYWIEIKRPEKGKVEFVPHLIDHDSGAGTQFVVCDMNGDGKLDVVISNKKGVYVFLQK